MKNTKKNRKKLLNFIEHLIIDHLIYEIDSKSIKMYIKKHPINEWL